MIDSNVQTAQAPPSSTRQTVTVVVPAKNEEGSIGMVLDAIRPHADEILVVDGRSHDQTTTIAQARGATVITDPGLGKGCALRLGIAAAKGDVIVFIDADGSHDPADIPRLVATLNERQADLVIGSRLLGGSDELHGNLSNYLRMVGAGFITLIINLRWNQELTDVENGFRAIRTSVAREIGLTANDFDIEQEMVMRTLKRGLRIAETPSHEFKRVAGTSKLPTWKGLKFLWRLFIGLF